MIKISIFVEGQTEQLLTTWLIQKLHPEGGITIDEKKIQGRVMSQINIIPMGKNDQFEPIYIQVLDCSGESGVPSRIKDRMSKLKEQNFNQIYALLDLHPRPLALYQHYLDGLNKGIGAKLVPTEIHLAIHEIEAWFIADVDCLKSMHPTLTPEKVYELIGFNPEINNVETFLNPADLLMEIIASVGKGYGKSKAEVNKIINGINFAFYNSITRSRVDKLGKYMNAIEDIRSIQGVA